jgi:effector-binding domain-containing protein
MNLETVTTEPTPMLFVTRTTSVNAPAIGTAMQEAFRTLGEFIGRNAVEVVGPPVSVYRDHTATSMTMDVGMPVTDRGLKLASGDIKAGTTPVGTALKALHVGPYDRLRDTYSLINTELHRRGSRMPAMSWEVYLDDPMTTPPAELRTEIYMPVDAKGA